MRLISQNGKYSFPFENVIVEIMDNNIFVCTGTGQPFKAAEYTSLEQAQKAMQMLHECYTGMLYMRNVDFGKDVDVKERLKESMRQGIGFITVFDTEENVKIEPMNIVFRFPKEDEV